ncbi:unnamed protein product [Macrosiphum euphorbiae]|uniref:Uncharacterized protein n=1 Tax=Macrosiphum euphorbiae TaxID=13131 RepID=A0AAV0VWM0_9HEMI|nr:unnamed protein product [Macrosiphum euphorbiae]
MTGYDNDGGDHGDREDRKDAYKPRATLTSCGARHFGEQRFERFSAVGIVKALVDGLHPQSNVHGRQREKALGVAHMQRFDTVVVVQHTDHVPAEPVQYVQEGFADQLVRAHHPGQSRVLFPVVEVLDQPASGQHRYLPHARVPRHGRNHVVAHRSQEQI